MSVPTWRDEQQRLAPHVIAGAPEQRPGHELEERVGRHQQRGLQRRGVELLGVDRQQRDDERQPEDVHQHHEEDGQQRATTGHGNSSAQARGPSLDPRPRSINVGDGCSPVGPQAAEKPVCPHSRHAHRRALRSWMSPQFVHRTRSGGGRAGWGRWCGGVGLGHGSLRAFTVRTRRARQGALKTGQSRLYTRRAGVGCFALDLLLVHRASDEAPARLAASCSPRVGHGQEGALAAGDALRGAERRRPQVGRAGHRRRLREPPRPERLQGHLQRRHQEDPLLPARQGDARRQVQRGPVPRGDRRRAGRRLHGLGQGHQAGQLA